MSGKRGNARPKSSKLGHNDSIIVTDLELTTMETPEDDEMPSPALAGATHLPGDFSHSQVSLPNAYDEDESDEASSEEDEERQEKLNLETQEILMKTFDEFYKQESETMLNILAMSRNGIKDTVVDLVEEQAGYKSELNRVSEGKYNNLRKKENSIPLAVYIRRKRDYPGSTDSSMASGINSISDSSASLYMRQHPTERLAVEKYMKKRERQKVSESNRISREKSGVDTQTGEVDRILSAVKGGENIKEKERERQMERIQMKLKSAKGGGKKDDKEVVDEILETYNDTQLAFEREKQQQEKRFQRLKSAKQGVVTKP